MVTAIVAAILGFPAFRVFGVGAGAANPIYFLLTTRLPGEILSRVVIAARKYTLGTNGLPVPKPDLVGLRLNAFQSYYLTLAITIICIFLMYRLANSRCVTYCGAFATTNAASRLWATTLGCTNTRPGSLRAFLPGWQGCSSPITITL